MEKQTPASYTNCFPSKPAHPSQGVPISVPRARSCVKAREKAAFALNICSLTEMNTGGREGQTNVGIRLVFPRLDFSGGKGGRTQDLDRYLTSTVVPLELTGFHSWAIPLLKSPWWGRKTSQQGQGAPLTFLSRIVQKTGRNRVVLAMGTRVPQVTWCRGTALADGSGDKYLPATGEGSKTKARDASSLVRLLLRAWEKIFFQAVAVDF